MQFDLPLHPLTCYLCFPILTNPPFFERSFRGFMILYFELNPFSLTVGSNVTIELGLSMGC